MFMIDMQGVPALPSASSSSRSPDEAACGSWMASTARSYWPGSTASGTAAERTPGRLRDSTVVRPPRPLTGIRTIVPRSLISAASSARPTRVTV